MPSQFFGLQIAGSGLRASNAALNTTANNIANAQTVGYSRQQVTQEASNALRTYTTYGCAGSGVDTIAIERLRDQFYNVRYWNNNCQYGEYEVKSYYCETIEDYFNDDGKTGFATVFGKLGTTLQSIVSNASSESTKKDFISSAKALTDYFNNMYGNLQELQKDLNLEIKQNVDQINSIAEKICTINKQINVIELSGGTANELRDQREVLVDELSEIVDVDVTEYEITDVNNPDRKTGGTRYVVMIAGGQPLVDANDYNTLSCVARTKEQKVNQTDVDGLYTISWSNGNEFSLTNAAMEGKLKGLIELRDGNNGTNFTGKVLSVTTSGTTASVVIEPGTENLKDMKTCNLSDTGGEIIIGNKVYYYDSWEYNQLTEQYTFTIKNDPSTGLPTAGDVNKDSKIGEAIKYQGIPYYMAQMNTWIRGFSEKVNEIFSSGIDGYGNRGGIFFTGEIPTGGQYTADQLVAYTDDASKQPNNGLYELTAGNFTVRSELLEDGNLLGTRSRLSDTEVQGVEESGQVQKMIELLTSKDKYSFRNGSANQMLEMILSDVALNASNANTFETTYKGLQNTIGNQRSSYSGVDEDEEAVSLVKYQSSYTLASKMIQTLTEVYDRLILQTGV